MLIGTDAETVAARIAGLPGSCRLLNVLGLDPPDAASIAARWQAGGRTTRAVIGACYDGPFGVDLARDGPHGPAPGGPPGTSGPPGVGHAPIPFGLIDLPACSCSRRR